MSDRSEDAKSYWENIDSLVTLMRMRESFLLDAWLRLNVPNVRFACEYFASKFCSTIESYFPINEALLKMCTRECACWSEDRLRDFSKIVDILIEFGADPWCSHGKRPFDELSEMFDRYDEEGSGYVPDLRPQRDLRARFNKMQFIPFLRSEYARELDEFVRKDIFDLFVRE